MIKKFYKNMTAASKVANFLKMLKVSKFTSTSDKETLVLAFRWWHPLVWLLFVCSLLTATLFAVYEAFFFLVNELRGGITVEQDRDEE